MDFSIEEDPKSSEASPVSTTTTTTGVHTSGTATTTLSGRPSGPPPNPPPPSASSTTATSGQSPIEGISSHFEDDLMREFDQKHSNLSSFLDDRVSDLTSNLKQDPGHKSPSATEQTVPGSVHPDSDPFDISGFPSSAANNLTGGKPSYGGYSQYPEASDIFQLSDPDNEYEIVKRETQEGHDLPDGANLGGKKHAGDVDIVGGVVVGGGRKKSAGELLFDMDEKEIGKTDFGFGFSGGDSPSGVGPGAGTGAGGDQGHGRGPGVVLDEHEQLMGQFERVSPNMMNFAYEDTTVTQTQSSHSHDVPPVTQQQPSATSTFSPPTATTVGSGFGQQQQTPIPQHQHFSDDEDDFEKDSISQQSQSQGLSSKLSDSLEAFQDIPRESSSTHFPPPIQDLFGSTTTNPPSSLGLGGGSGGRSHDFFEDDTDNDFEKDSFSQPLSSQKLSDSLEVLKDSPSKDLRLDESLMEIEELPSSKNSLKSISPNEPDSVSPMDGSAGGLILGLGDDDILPPPPLVGSGFGFDSGPGGAGEFSESDTDFGGSGQNIQNSSSSPFDMLSTESDSQSQSSAILGGILGGGMDEVPEVTQTQPLSTSSPSGLPDISNSSNTGAPNLPEVTTTSTTGSSDISGNLPDITTSTTSETPSASLQDSFPITPEEEEIPPPIPPHQNLGSPPKFTSSIPSNFDDDIEIETETQPEIQDILNPFKSNNGNNDENLLSNKFEDMEKSVSRALELKGTETFGREKNLTPSPSPPPIPPHRQQPQTEVQQPEETEDIFRDTDNDSKEHQSITEDMEDLLPKETEKTPSAPAESAIQESSDEAVLEQFEFSMAEAEAPEINVQTEKENIIQEAKNLVSEILETASETKEDENDDHDNFDSEFEAPEGQPKYELKVDEPEVTDEPEVEETELEPISVPVPVLKSKSSYQENFEISEDVEKILNTFNPRAWFQPEKLHPTVGELVYWRDPKKSGIVFGALLVILLALTSLSLISVVAYTSLAVLSGTLAFRVYKSVLQAIQKTQDGHPFKEYLDLDLAVSTERGQELSTAVINYLNATAAKLRSLFLVEDIVESAKFGVALYLLTYIGAWFNGLTLVILGLIALFAAPKVYETNKTIIDQYLDLVQAKISEITNKVTTAVPFLAKKEKPQ